MVNKSFFSPGDLLGSPKLSLAVMEHWLTPRDRAKLRRTALKMLRGKGRPQTTDPMVRELALKYKRPSNTWPTVARRINRELGTAYSGAQIGKFARYEPR
jgi:hypothetical protein